jgi:WD repeat-containing protein 19
MDSVVRLSLEKLNAPQRAYAIVRKTKSVEAAALLARYCLGAQVGLWSSNVNREESEV